MVTTVELLLQPYRMANVMTGEEDKQKEALSPISVRQ
jgi:hypothetical protein